MLEGQKNKFNQKCMIHFNPDYQKCHLVAEACMLTHEHTQFLNAYQPFPVPSVDLLAQSIFNPPGKILSAIIESESGQPVGYIFCGNFFPPHSDKGPHLVFGLNKDFHGQKLMDSMLRKFFLKIQNDNLAKVVYGHCYKSNIAACRTMEMAFMTGTNIGTQSYSHGHEVMEYRVSLNLPEFLRYDAIMKNKK